MSTTQLLDVKPSEVKPHPHNPRLEVGDVTELAASIKTAGILEPLIVAPREGEGGSVRQPYVLIAGHRRLAAAKVVKLKTVPVLVRGDLDTDASQREAMLIENCHRVDLTAIEEGAAYQALLDLPGYTQKSLAEKVAHPVARIRERLKLNALPEQQRTQLHQGQMTIGEGLGLVEFSDDPAASTQLLRLVGSSAFAGELTRLRDKRTHARKVTAWAKELTDAGTRIVERGEAHEQGVQLEQLISGCPAQYYNFDLRLIPRLTEWAAGHADCPGHAAVIDEAAARWAHPIRWYCMQPDLHREEDAAADALHADREPTPEELAEAARREQEQADLQTAAASRLAHLQDLVRSDPSDEVAAAALRSWASSVFCLEGLDKYTAQVLGASYPVRPSGEDWDVWLDRLDEFWRAELAELSANQMVVLFDLSFHAGAEGSLTRTANGSTWNRDEYCSLWIRKLEDVYGYEWTAFEAGLLAAAEGGDDE